MAALGFIFTTILLSVSATSGYHDDNNHMLRYIFKPAIHALGLSYVSWQGNDFVTGTRFRLIDTVNGCYDCGVNNTGLHCKQIGTHDCSLFIKPCPDEWKPTCDLVTYRTQDGPIVPPPKAFKVRDYYAGAPCYVEYADVKLQPRPDSIIFRNHPMEVCTFLSPEVMYGQHKQNIANLTLNIH